MEEGNPPCYDLILYPYNRMKIFFVEITRNQIVVYFRRGVLFWHATPFLKGISQTVSGSDESRDKIMGNPVIINDA